MVYKSLLTFHAAGEPIGALDEAIELASVSNAHLDIIILGILTSATVYAGHDIAPAVEWIQQNQEVMDIALKQVEEVEKHVAEKGVSATVVAECDYPKNLETIAARYALCTDALVITSNSLKANESDQRAFSGSLFDAGCPVLLLPTSKKPLGEISNIAIAWNGRAEASRAVRNALPLLKKAGRINIIVIDPIEGDVGQDPGNDLATFLSRHGINITVDVLASGGMTVAEKLMQRTNDIDSDMLIMGGYGHTKFREWLLGGTTRETLESAKLPVLLVH